MVRMAVQNVDIDTMPLLLILVSNKISMETFTVIRGNVGVNDLLTSLVETIDVFQVNKITCFGSILNINQCCNFFNWLFLLRNIVKMNYNLKKREWLEKELNRNRTKRIRRVWMLIGRFYFLNWTKLRLKIKKNIDRKKCMFRAKEEAKQLQVQMQRQMREQEESMRLAQEAKREAHRQSIMSSLPPEPTSEVGVIKVRVRLPTNIPDKILERKFFNNTPLQILLNYLTVEGFPTDEYKVISSWPRRDVRTSSNQFYILVFTLTILTLFFPPFS